MRLEIGQLAFAGLMVVVGVGGGVRACAIRCGSQVMGEGERELEDIRRTCGEWE